MKAKLLLTFLFVIIFCTSSVFSQQQYYEKRIYSSDYTSFYCESVEDKYVECHPTAKSIRLSYEYTSLDRHLIITYICEEKYFDEGEALNTIYQFVLDFAKENGFLRPPFQNVKNKKKFCFPTSGNVSYIREVYFKNE